MSSKLQKSNVCCTRLVTTYEYLDGVVEEITQKSAKQAEAAV